MHDPSTLALTIPSPFFQRVTWGSGRYHAPLVEVWHEDPEVGGNDDSCDWHGHRSLTPDERKWLHAEGQSEPDFMIRGVEQSDNPGHYWPGGMVHASAFELLYGIWTIILWRMPRNGRKALYLGPFAGWRMRRGLAVAVPHLLGMVSMPTDNLHTLIARARAADGDGKKAMGELFAAVYRIMKGEARPWWRHPRWHLHHWRVRVPAVSSFKRWLFSRCATCGKRFSWGYAPITNSWNSDGPRWFRGERDVHHHECAGGGCSALAPATGGTP